MITKSTFSLALAIAASTAGAYAQVTPEIVKVVFPNNAFMSNLSDNGNWAVAYGTGDDQSLPDYPYLCNAVTGELTELWDDDNPVANGISAYDVTDDGSLVVGSYNGKPAIYSVSTGTWTELESDWGGQATRITPDGSRIAGWGASEDFSLTDYEEVPLYWELQSDGTYKAIDVYTEFTGFPTTTDEGTATSQVRIENMSADGNIVAGAIEFVTPQTACYYVYDRTTQTTRYIDSVVPTASYGSFVDQSVMSCNGAYLTGQLPTVTSSGNEYTCSYLYSTSDNTINIYDETSEEQDRGGTAVTNSGIVLACSPAVNVIRSAYVLYNKIWFGLDELLSDRYGINFYDRTDYEYTGLIVAVSEDERVIAGMSLTSGEAYFVRLNEDLADLCANVNPIQSYTFSPASGSQFARFRSVTLTFTKPVTLTSGVQATLLDDTGATVRPYNITANSDGYSFTIGGIATTLEAGRTYTLSIPAGAFTLTADASYASEAITATYTGVENVPVTMTVAAPADGANVSELSTNSPVQMAFSSQIVVADGAVGYLYEDGNDTPLTELSLSASSNILTMAPALRRYLSKDVEYTVVLPDSAVTDIMGDCGNEQVTLHYTGVYEPEFDLDGNLFYDDFDDPSQSMATYLLYEGDNNTPTTAMEELGFDASNNPWNFTIRESTSSSDYCAASHSMYSPAGASDDWMSLPQLTIENANYWLSFDAQSYLTTKTDSLMVIVLEEDGGYTRFTSDLYEAFQERGVVIFNDQLSPGTEEEDLDGEWQSVNISLEQFSGKNIYIAFVNRNVDQSMVFVDNIRVYYNGDFYFQSTADDNVVAQDEITIGVRLLITGADTYNDLEATLTAADGDFTSTYSATGLGLTSDSGEYRFEFPEAMPLTIGENNRYTITVVLDSVTVSQTSTIGDLAFETTKRVVLEEGTGMWCGNCPGGILAIEYMENLFGDRFVPISIHDGTSGYDLYPYNDYNSYLGITAFPQGRVNRIDTLYAPLYSGTDGYSFSSPTGNQTFLDVVQREFESIAEADITITNAYYDTERSTVRVAGNVNYALTQSGLNQNIVFVVVENGLTGLQNNYYYNYTDEIFGDFGSGGIYGTAQPTITHQNVARRVLGSLFVGVSGLIPVSVEANDPVDFDIYYSMPENVTNWGNAEVVAMLTNANTGRVINAARVAFEAGEANAISDATTDAVNISVSGGRGLVNVAAPAGATVSVYDLSGVLVARATADGSTAISTNGRSGLMIVSVNADGISEQRKVIVK